MIVDTSALLAYFDAAEPEHEACARVIEAASDDLVVSPFVVAELDYLVSTRIGVEAELAVLNELASGAWTLAVIGTDDLDVAARIVRRYADCGRVARAAGRPVPDSHGRHPRSPALRRAASTVRRSLHPRPPNHVTVARSRDRGAEWPVRVGALYGHG